MNGQSTDLSFIIPCYNLENYIEKLLLSFYMLDMGDYDVEFIFVLDHCDDGTEDIIRRYMGDANYQIIKGNYYSCGLARNAGMDVATGRYIWFVDGDDWLIYPFTAKECISVCDERDIDMIKLWWVSDYYGEDRGDMVWQYIFNHDLIRDLRFREEQPGEDGDFMNKLLEKRQSKEAIHYKIPSYFYNYNRPGSNMTIAREKRKKAENSNKEI